MGIMTLADLDDELRRRRRIRKAWPNVPTIGLDLRIAELDVLTTLHCVYFDGCAHRAPCAQLHIAADPAHLPSARDPRCWSHAPTPDRLHTPLGSAIDRAIRRLGCGAAAESNSTLLAKLGIDRGPRSYGHPGKVLTGFDERVAEAIARCLTHLIEPRPDAHVQGIQHPVARANSTAVSRSRPGHTARHGQSLRTAA